MQHPQVCWRDWWRVPRIAWHCLKRPGDIPRYVRYGIGARSSPLEMGMPWWSFGAVDAVAKLLHPDMEVFEFGSGGSSLFLGRRVKHVTCVEDSETWAGLVRERAAQLGLVNLEVLLRPFDFQRAENFSGSDYLGALGGQSYDLIVVDGQEESVPVRPECFWKAENHIHPGGIIVLDDSWRYPCVEERHRAKSRKIFQGTGYCRRGVTSTALFFY